MSTLLFGRQSHYLRKYFTTPAVTLRRRDITKSAAINYYTTHAITSHTSYLTPSLHTFIAINSHIRHYTTHAILHTFVAVSHYTSVITHNTCYHFAHQLSHTITSHIYCHQFTHPSSHTTHAITSHTSYHTPSLHIFVISRYTSAITHHHFTHLLLSIYTAAIRYHNSTHLLSSIHTYVITHNSCHHSTHQLSHTQKKPPAFLWETS